MNFPKEFNDTSSDERAEDIFTRFGISLKFAYDLESTPESKRLEKIQMAARAIAQNAASSHMANLILKGSPIVIDTTGENVEKLTNRIESLAHIGYDVAVVQVNVPTEFSIQRDQERKRTVGKTITKQISTQFQEDVVASEGYFEQLRALPNVTLLGDAVFPNIFCLSDRVCDSDSYGKYLSGVTDEMIGQEVEDDLGQIVKPFANITPQIAMAILQNIQNDTAQFLSNANAGPLNPRGRKIFKGMRALVSLSNGVIGQNFTDIIPALGHSKYANNDHIIAAALALSDVDELDLKNIIPKTKRTATDDVAGSGGHKKPHVPTIRGLTNIEEVIKLVLKKND